MATEKPVWLITGCSSGFGRDLARYLLAQGYRVAATARNPETLRELLAGHEVRAVALALDVTDANSVSDAVAAAQARFGQIDVLVNNAGYGYMAAIEEGEDDAVRLMFETNFFGTVTVTKAVLPGMRARRSGAIVNISSIGGLVSFPATGYYHATKFALEGLSGSLCVECAPLGIKVMVVEPGPFRTDFAGRSLVTSKIEIADYDATAGNRRRETKARDGRQPGDPARAAQAIIDAVASPETPAHLPLGAMALDLARRDLVAKTQLFDRWEKTILGTDFPEGE